MFFLGIFHTNRMENPVALEGMRYDDKLDDDMENFIIFLLPWHVIAQNKPDNALG